MRRRLPEQFYRDAEAKRKDAAETAFVERAFAWVETKTYDTIFPPLKGLDIVPMDTSPPPGATAYIYRQYTLVGIARLVNARGGDVPLVGAFVKEFVRKFYRLGAAYEYTIDEMLEAQLAVSRGLGMSIDLTKAKAAKMAIARGLDYVAAVGSAPITAIAGLTQGIGYDVGMVGLINLPNSITYTVAVGGSGSTAWSTKTPDEKVADMAGLLASVVLATYEAFRPNTLFLPTAQYLVAAAQRMGDGSDETVISFALKTLSKVYPGLVIDSWIYLAGAGTGGTDRMIAFDRDPDKVRLMVSEEFRQEPPQYNNWEVKVLCSAKTAGVVSPYPISVAVGDGI